VQARVEARERLDVAAHLAEGVGRLVVDLHVARTVAADDEQLVAVAQPLIT
jgi:hypothetical protein